MKNNCFFECNFSDRNDFKLWVLQGYGGNAGFNNFTRLNSLSDQVQGICDRLSKYFLYNLSDK